MTQPWHVTNKLSGSVDLSTIADMLAHCDFGLACSSFSFPPASQHYVM